MVSSADLREEVASEKRFLADEQAAEQYFTSQSDAIKAIKDTRGYQEIRMYFVREWEACIDRFETMQSDDPKKYLALQAKLSFARKFLDFLDNITQ